MNLFWRKFCSLDTCFHVIPNVIDSVSKEFSINTILRLRNCNNSHVWIVNHVTQSISIIYYWSKSTTFDIIRIQCWCWHSEMFHYFHCFIGQEIRLLFDWLEFGFRSLELTIGIPCFLHWSAMANKWRSNPSPVRQDIIIVLWALIASRRHLSNSLWKSGFSKSFSAYREHKVLKA